VQTSTECKTERLAVLTVMSGLGPHMINKHKDEIKSWFDELWVVLLLVSKVGWYKLTPSKLAFIN
jgi:hypothetical protein